jgi:regulatory protein
MVRVRRRSRLPVDRRKAPRRLREAADATVPPVRAGVVTSLAAKRGRSDRYAVYVEGKRSFEVAVEVVARTGLRQGDVLGEDELARLLLLDAPFRAKDVALAMLAQRERCAREIEERLRVRGFTEEVVVDTVVWLRDREYVSDGRYAASFAEGRLKAGWGARRIRAELLRKGVDRETTEESLRAAVQEDPADQGMAAVMALVRRKFGSQFAQDPAAARRRLSGFLARRGYDWDAIGAVTRALSDEAGERAEGSDEAVP